MQLFLVNIYDCSIIFIQEMENTTENKTSNLLFDIPQPFIKDIIFLICLAMYILSFFFEIKLGKTNLLYYIPIFTMLTSFQMMFFNRITEHLRNKFIYALSIIILIALAAFLKEVSYELSSSFFSMAITLGIMMKKVFKK